MFSVLKALTGPAFENKKESLLNIIRFFAENDFQLLFLTENDHHPLLGKNHFQQTHED